MHGSRGLSLAAGLIVISWTAVDAAPPPRCGVWWDQSWCPDLRTKDDAPQVWANFTAHHLMFGTPPEPGTDVKENPEAMTLAQWAASSWQPYSTSDLAVLKCFDRLGVLVTIAPMLRVPTASALDPSDFAEVTSACFNNGISSVRALTKNSSDSRDRPHVEIFDGTWDVVHCLMAAGDVNGDGWQDWLITFSGRLRDGGTLPLYNTYLITRRGDGPLIDITNQLPCSKTGPDGVASWQAARASQPAWPEGKPRAFTGTITVDGKRLGITMTLTCSNTLLSGTYRYDHIGKDIPLAGSVGADGSLSLHEFPGPGLGRGRFNVSRDTAGRWMGTWKSLVPCDYPEEPNQREGTVTLAPKR